MRDRLAAVRTALANERTLLGYVRTALALVIGGVGALKVFAHDVTDVLGWLLIAVGIVLLLVGLARYRTVARGLGGHGD